MGYSFEASDILMIDAAAIKKRDVIMTDAELDEIKKPGKNGS